jgi:ATP-dependent Lon protease
MTNAGKTIVVAQINEEDEDPTKKDIHRIGTVARNFASFKMPDGNITVILQGKSDSRLILLRNYRI